MFREIHSNFFCQSIDILFALFALKFRATVVKISLENLRWTSLCWRNERQRIGASNL